MTIHWKAVEQYFTVMLFVKPLTARVKPWVIQSFLTFDSMDRTRDDKCDHSIKAVEQYFTVVWFLFNFPQLAILENLFILDLVLSGVIRLSKTTWNFKPEGSHLSLLC